MKILLALAGAVTIVAAPAMAHADDPLADHRPCVTKREYRSTQPDSRENIERRWEAKPAGVDHVFGRTTLYKRCGYSLDEGWYGVVWPKSNDTRIVLVKFTATGATPSGVERGR